MDATFKARRLHATAVALAPAFRDKFDFSNPSQYDQLADMAFLAAEALERKFAPIEAAALKQDDPKVEPVKEAAHAS